MNFQQKVYQITKQIPKGKVTNYKEMARVWWVLASALAKNPDLIITPCHRLIRSNGNISEYALGKVKKLELLKSGKSKSPMKK